MILRYAVTPAEAGRSVESICRRELRLSAAALRKAKAGQGLLVNGSPAFASAVLRAGDEVSVRLREEAPAYPPESGELCIVF